MRYTWNCAALLFVFLISPMAGHASRGARDIVYAARYYLPPGTPGKSHFHLYRINPDGTGRTQITFGKCDDEDPFWSPDGRKILFTRSFADTSVICVVSAMGGAPKKVLNLHTHEWILWPDRPWSPDGSMIIVSPYTRDARTTTLVNLKTGIVKHLRNVNGFYWSPDGKRAYVAYPDHGEIMDIKTEKTVRVSARLYSEGPQQEAVWLTKDTLVGICSKPDNAHLQLSIIGVDGV